MEKQPGKGFGYWFKNVFWYHYGKLSILVALMLAAAIWMTVEAFQKEEFDLNAAIITEGGIAETDTAALNRLFAEVVGDVNGDGKVLVNIQTVNLSDVENLENNQYRMLLYMTLPEYTVFIMNDYYSNLYAGKDDTFQPLGNYGIETDEEGGRRACVTQKALLHSLGDWDYYVCLSDWTVDGKGSTEMTAAGVRAIQALLDSPDVPAEEES